MKGYVVQIDSLNQLNNKLTDENKTVKSQLSNEQKKAQELTEKNEDLNTLVTVASHLKTLGLKSHGVKVKTTIPEKKWTGLKRWIKLELHLLCRKTPLPNLVKNGFMLEFSLPMEEFYLKKQTILINLILTE